MHICQNNINNNTRNDFVEILNQNIEDKTYSKSNIEKRINLLESVKFNVEDLEGVMNMAKRINDERYLKDAQLIKESQNKI